MNYPNFISKRKNNQSFHRKPGAPSGPRNADQRRATILETAGMLFVEKGFDATTMEEIAAAAGFAKGTLYHYFNNKADLLNALKDSFEREVMNRVRSQVESRPIDDWSGRIKAWINAAVDAYFEMSDLHDVVIYGLGVPFRHAMADAEITTYLARLISDGAKAGAWHVDDEKWTSAIMFYCFRGGCDEAIMGTQRAEDVPSKLYDTFIRILGLHVS